MTREATFGARIKELRIEKRLSVRKAALAVGISHHRLDELERGVSRSTGNPTRASRETVKKLAEVYVVPHDSLLELAGYAREHRDLNDEESLLVDLFRRLDDDQRSMAVRIMQAIPNPKASLRGPV